ncbi:MAG: hypothetical protein A2284_07590 [Deltaproteobacteria bacterium RIFOXYA12_FULL_61_11]|nr:MAG: hypothetical protein A2284_07590 [Deltaproteobacteria bacterium RIFOXYA12_FULL_61_11]
MIPVLPSLLRALLRSFFEVLQPRSEVFPFSLEDELLVSSERYLANFPRFFTWGLTLALLGLNIATSALLLRPVTFRGLPLSEREALCQRWSASRFMPLREVMRLLKILAVMGFYEHPRVMEAMGYRPDEWIAEVSRRRLETYGEEIDR